MSDPRTLEIRLDGIKPLEAALRKLRQAYLQTGNGEVKTLIAEAAAYFKSQLTYVKGDGHFRRLCGRLYWRVD